MLHTSYIELSQKALRNNVEYLKKLAGENVRYSMVIKSNAYGHGIEDLIPMAADCGVDHFSVFSVAEAQRALKVISDKCELMVMGWVDDDYLSWIMENEISYFVFTMHRLKKSLDVAKETGQKAKIHIELETGMHRTGFHEDDLEEVAALINDNPDHLKMEGLCTHYAGAERMTNFSRVRAQIKTFRERCAWFKERGLKPRYRHTASSAGLFNFPEATHDLVRIGISNYGFWPGSETKMRHITKNDLDKDPLERVLSWKSEIMSVNPVAEGEWVSYGKSYRTNRPSKIATVPVGYGYGYSRELSNHGHVLVEGKRVPVVGTVNMNEMVLDVTDVGDVEVGDEVVLIGEQNGLTITVSSFGEMNKSMNYEMLARLPQHIPRVAVE